MCLWCHLEDLNAGSARSIKFGDSRRGGIDSGALPEASGIQYMDISYPEELSYV